MSGYKLKPCPFCGNKDVKLNIDKYKNINITDNIYVECKCGGFMANIQDEPAEEVVSKWNTRREGQ